MILCAGYIWGKPHHKNKLDTFAKKSQKMGESCYRKKKLTIKFLQIF